MSDVIQVYELTTRPESILQTIAIPYLVQDFRPFFARTSTKQVWKLSDNTPIACYHLVCKRLDLASDAVAGELDPRQNDTTYMCQVLLD